MNSKKRILVFSDFDSIRQIVVKSLQNKAYTVVETKTYDEAVFQLNGTSFSLIITDNDVKNKAGIKLIEYLRGLSSYLYTPVMLFHSSNQQQISEMYSELKIGAYLNKPFEMERFHSIVSRMA
ncbi:MAG: response regulator [Bacteroidota bacterium]|nr:MAG: response regulator [Bacteroidota bacterium]